MADLYVIESKKIDAMTTIRRRVKLTPDRCRICGLSLCENNKLPSFDKLQPGIQQAIKEALAKHKEIAHPASSKAVVSKENLPKQWLGKEGGSDASTQTPEEGWQVEKQSAVDL